MTTLVINTPDSSRTNWDAVRKTLNRHGFEVHKHHAQITDGGQTIVSRVYRPQGDEAATARAALLDMTAGTTLYVLH
jgi:hypothetical protein